MVLLPTLAETSISTVKNKRKLSTPCLEAVGLPELADLKAVDLEAGINNNKQRQDFFLTFFCCLFYDRIENQSAYRKEHDEKTNTPSFLHTVAVSSFSISLCAGP